MNRRAFEDHAARVKRSGGAEWPVNALKIARRTPNPHGASTRRTQAIWPQIAWCLVLHYVSQESDCADRSHVVATKHRDSRFHLTFAEAMNFTLDSDPERVVGFDDDGFPSRYLRLAALAGDILALPNSLYSEVALPLMNRVLVARRMIPSARV